MYCCEESPLQGSGRLGGMQGRLVRSEPIGLQAHLLSYGIPFPIRREVNTIYIYIKMYTSKM